jgi:tetratricopeptide (TPR) repeat protein
VVVALSLAVAGLVVSVNWARAQSTPANNNPTQNYLAQGDTLLRAGANQQALEKYAEGLASDPGNRVAYQKREIEVFMRMGRKAEAAEVNAQLLKEHPDDTDALAFGAVILLDQGNTAAAAAQLQQVLTRVPDNPVAHLELGRVYANQGNITAARREMETAIRLRPDFVRAKEALERLGSTAGNTGDDDELARLQSEGSAALRSGNYDLAIYTFQKLLDRMDQASETRAEGYLRLADAYLRKGDTGAAIQAMEKAHQLAPGNRAALGPLIVLLDAVGRHSEADQLRAEAETTEVQRSALTTQFLSAERAEAAKRLEELRRLQQPDSEAIQRSMAQLADLTRKLSASQPATGCVLERIYFVGVPEAMRPQAQLPVHIGDTLTVDSIEATYSAMKALDPSVVVQFTVQEN